MEILDMGTLYGQTHLLGGGELFGVYDDFTPSIIDPFFQPNDHLLLTNPNTSTDDDYYTIPQSYLTSYPLFSDKLVSLPPELIPDQYYHYPKRQRLNYDDILFDCCNTYHCPDFFLSNPTEQPIQASPLGYSCSGGGESEKKSNGGCLSAQTIAARQRRRKISDKTQELGKLIPGGNRMNTGEMFQAAYKYIKYLQAQVAVLQLMGSTSTSTRGSKDEDNCENVEGLDVLLASPIIQEKLYSEEKCLVPQEFVAELTKTKEIKSNPLLSEEIESLVHTKEST